MRKKILIFTLFIFTLFLAQDVYAIDITYEFRERQDYTEMEHFNFYEEVYLNTPLSEAIIVNKNNLWDYFKEITGYTTVYNNFTGIYIYKENNDYIVVMSSGAQQETRMPFSFTDWQSYGSFSGYNKIKFDSAIYSGMKSATYRLSYSMELLEILPTPVTEFTRPIDNNGKAVNDAYFYSGLIYSSRGINSNYDLRVHRLHYYDIYNNKSEYSFYGSNYTGLTNLWNKIFNNDMNISWYLHQINFGFDYFTKNYLATKTNGFSSINKMIGNKEGEAVIPDGWLNTTITHDNQKWFIPISKDDAICRSSKNFYIMSTSNGNGKVIQQNFLIDNEHNEIMVDLESAGYYEYRLEQSMYRYRYSINYDTNYNFYDYIFLLNSSHNFYDFYVYYNPSCFEVKDFSYTDNVIFENINTGQDITLTPYEQKFIANSVKEEKRVEYEKEQERLNLENSTNNGSAFDIPNLLKNSISSMGGFIASIGTIGTMALSFLNFLPTEVRALLYFSFTIGIIIILIKLIFGK